MVYYDLEEYAGVEMSKNGILELINLLAEFLLISRKHISLAKPHYRISKLLKDDNMKEYHHNKAQGHLSWAEINFGIVVQISITILEWKKRLKK